MAAKKYCLFLVLIVVLGFTLVGCGNAEKKGTNVYRSADEARPLVEDKYSISADRKAFDEIRSQIPEEKKRQNDQLALILQMVSDSQTELKKAPADIRSQFDGILRKKREQFDKDLTRERETVTKEERKKREAFLNSQQSARDGFASGKHTRDEKNEFYKDLDEKRSEYFSSERERRADFESDSRERRKNFEDYTRGKSNEFNQELRAYQKRYDEAKKERENQQFKGSAASSGAWTPSAGTNSEAAELEREIQEAKRKAGTVLESGE